LVQESALNKEFGRQCEKNGLLVEIRDLKRLYGEEIRVKIAYISKEKELIENAARAEETGDRKKIASLLGYPACCSDFFIKYFPLHDQQPSGEEGGITKKVLSFSKKPYPHELNFFFNFDSRLKPSKLNAEQIKIVENISQYCLYFINHVPCSLNCKASLKKARAMAGVIKEREPGFAETVSSVLKKPIFYLDDFLISVFEHSKVENSRIVPELSTITGKNALKKLKSGKGRLLRFK